MQVNNGICSAVFSAYAITVNLVPAISIGRQVDGGLLTTNKVTINGKVSGSRVDVYKDNILVGSVTTNSY